VSAATRHTQQHPALQDILRRQVWASTAPQCQVQYLHHVPLPVAVTHRCKAFIFASRNLLPPSSGPQTCLCNCYGNTKCCDNLLTDFRCQTSRGNNIYKRFKQGTQQHVQEYNIKIELQIMCSDDSGGLLWTRQ